MNTQHVIGFYRTQQAIADALGIAQPSVAKWFRNDSVPQLRQLQLEALTGGALKADSGILPRKTRKRK